MISASSLRRMDGAFGLPQDKTDEVRILIQLQSIAERAVSCGQEPLLPDIELCSRSLNGFSINPLSKMEYETIITDLRTWAAQNPSGGVGLNLMRIIAKIIQQDNVVNFVSENLQVMNRAGALLAKFKGRIHEIQDVSEQEQCRKIIDLWERVGEEIHTALVQGVLKQVESTKR